MATVEVSTRVLEQLLHFAEHDIRIVSAVALGWRGTIVLEIDGPTVPPSEVVAEYERSPDGRVILKGLRSIA